MATKEKIATACPVSGAELYPYDGTNEFKFNTSLCSTCGMRCDADGIPTAGPCPFSARTQATNLVESSSGIVEETQKIIDARVADGIKDAKKDYEDQIENLTKANAALVKDHASSIEDLNKSHTEEINKLQGDIDKLQKAAAKP